MDKEIVRIIIIATGLLIIMGILLWSYLKDKQLRQAFDFFDDEMPIRQRRKSPANTEFEAVEKPEPIAKAHIVEEFEEEYEIPLEEDEEDDYIEPKSRPIAPEIIQLTLIARAEKGFNGADLVNALETAGLIYGKLKIFERLDNNRMVDFGVACLTPPGTFPDKNLKTFYCSGVVFFMQPSLLDDPVSVFDELIEVIGLLATDLDGKVYDNDKQLLTFETMKAIRRSL
ncbi:MAG: cell division protein ZipA C-terminal FtsZ-binding domain-containing protein [Methylococcaceae bacterium]